MGPHLPNLGRHCEHQLVALLTENRNQVEDAARSEVPVPLRTMRQVVSQVPGTVELLAGILGAAALKPASADLIPRSARPSTPLLASHPKQS